MAQFALPESSIFLAASDDSESTRLSSHHFPPLKIMDELSFELAEVPELTKLMSPLSRIGKAVLRRSIAQPLTRADSIRSKQLGVQELLDDEHAYDVVKGVVESGLETERGMLDYANGLWNTNGMFRPSLYRVYTDTRNFFKEIGTKSAEAEVESDYANYHLDRIRHLEKADIGRWINERACLSRKGLTPKSDLHWAEPRFEFKPHDYKPLRYVAIPTIMTGICGPMLYGLYTSAGIDIDMRSLVASVAAPFTLLSPYFVMAGAQFGRSFDDSKYVRPIQKKLFGNPDIEAAAESYGALDELVSLADYAKGISGARTFPKLIDRREHAFFGRNIRNPVLNHAIEDCVPFSIDLREPRLTITTGPNSGGKTTDLKTVPLTHVLGQIGSMVPGEEVAFTVTDHIAYRAPMIDSLHEPGGTLWKEVTEQKAVFFQTSPRSVVLLDELFRGTTTEEEFTHSHRVLNGYRRMGNTTILVTHNHRLADSYAGAKDVQFLQVEFDGDKPTRQLIPGISRFSRAGDVFEEVGFTDEAIEAYVQKQRAGM